MTVKQDPENHETRVLFDLVNFEGKRVLEIGSGDGRLTWRFADRAAHVTAIEPWRDGIAQAREDLPSEVEGRVEFHEIAFEAFALGADPASYDIVLLSWSLC